jgi:hypothetical protein
MFAPGLTRVVSFPVVTLSWNEPGRSVTLLSDNEPADRRSFFRVGRFRLRRASEPLDLAPWFAEQPREGNDQGAAEDFDFAGADWREQIRVHVSSERISLWAWLSWRVREYQRQQPYSPWPDEVRLSVRLYRIPNPSGPRDWDWQDLGEHQVLRWRDPERNVAPWEMEVFDPVAGRFKRPGTP